MPTRRSLSKGVRLAVLERDGWTCAYCGKALMTSQEAARLGRRCDQYEIDHIVPVVSGGTNDMSNLLAACLSCNRSKCDRPLSVWGAG